MLKSACLLLLASLPAAAFANCETEAAQCCEPFLPPQPIESCQVPVGYFYPAQYGFDHCWTDISIGAEFIYWELNKDSALDHGTKIAVSNNGTTRRNTNLWHHQGYKPGFKISAGIALPGCDDWQADLEYTWLHTKSTNHVTAPENGFLQVSFIQLTIDPALFFFQANTHKSTRRFDLDFIAATVGKSFYLSQRLIVNAGAGLKAWWSKYHSHLLYQALDGSRVTELSKSGLWGIGPYVTANIKGLLWCGTYLFGKAAIWPTYTRFNKFKSVQNYPFSFPNLTTQNRQRISTFSWTTQLFYEGSIGLGWGTYLCNCSYHVDFQVGYDMMTNWIRGLTSAGGDTFKEFYYQGLSIKAQFDF